MKKIFLFLIIAVLLFAINNLARSIVTLWQKRELLTKADQELKKVKAENKRLKEQVKIVEGSQFVEQEARNKLLLGKPGEQIVIMPKNSQNEKQKKPSTQPIKSTPNWQQWLNLVLGEKS